MKGRGSSVKSLDISRAQIVRALIPMAFGLAGCAFGLISLCAYIGLASQTRIVPYVVTVDRTGAVLWRDDLKGSPKIPEAAVMYLINALSFDAEWMEKYLPGQVAVREFTNADGTKVPVQMMHGTESTLIDTENAEGFMKPYYGGDYSFAAVLPKGDASADELAASLDGQALADMLTKTQPATVVTTIPKFESSYSESLVDALKAMGVTDAFEAERADFSGMGKLRSGMPVFVSEVLHKTAITVNEQGTRAAAVTAVEMNEGAAMPTREIVLDRPFVYMIVDNATRLPIFLGVMNRMEPAPAREAETLCEHNYIETVTHPTCTEDGYIVRECRYCGERVIRTADECDRWSDWYEILSGSTYRFDSGKNVNRSNINTLYKQFFADFLRQTTDMDDSEIYREDPYTRPLELNNMTVCFNDIREGKISYELELTDESDGEYHYKIRFNDFDLHATGHSPTEQYRNVRRNGAGQVVYQEIVTFCRVCGEELGVRIDDTVYDEETEAALTPENGQC